MKPRARFLTRLQVEKPNGTWRLLAPLRFYSSRLNRIITVPAGFKTDFASVPRLPLTYALAGNSAHAAAVVHDWLYGLRVPRDGEMEPVSRRDADAVFYEAMQATREPAWRRWLMWGAVRAFGWTVYRQRRRAVKQRDSVATVDAALISDDGPPESG